MAQFRGCGIAAGWLLAFTAFTACTQAPPPHPPPRWELAQTDKPVQPAPAQGRNTPALGGGREAAHSQVGAMEAGVLQEAMRRSAQLPDPARPIDPEAARAAARAVPGVRSVVWVDGENLLALVDSNARRSHQTIDEICYQLQPLGDTLAVVVNLQSSAARNGDELEILSRNCQLVPGDRAAMQAQRQIDVLDPALRAQYRASKERTQRPARRAHDAGDRKALEAIPEM
jgi:hypothetical protein